MSNVKTNQIAGIQKHEPNDQQTTLDYILGNSITNNVIAEELTNRLDMILHRLDKVADRLNPDAYFKNQPEEECKLLEGKMGKIGPFLSGVVMKINDTLESQATCIERLDRKLNVFSRTVSFFEEQI